MTGYRLLHVSLAIFLVTLALLMVEILLIRVLDVILLPNIGYAVITLAMFASGLAGVYATIAPASTDRDIRRRVSLLALLFAISVVLIRPALNMAPALYGALPSGMLKNLAAAGGIYLVLMIPFFLSGLVLSYVFSAFPSAIRRLYFWDLAGAALGCVIFLPFVSTLGPGGLMLCAAAAALLAAGLFSGSRRWTTATAIVALGLVLMPVLNDGYFEFLMHVSKRGVREAQLTGQIEYSEWGPISKIDVISQTDTEPLTGEIVVRKHVAYDGGSQSSHFFQFDGDYERLRQDLSSPSGFSRHFWIRGVVLSHYLKRDTGAEVLIIGSAAGQETKAALLFNPRRVDGIEMVESVVRLGRGRYSSFIGHIFNDPRVHIRVGEGRTFLRTTDKKYDIVQIFSNHTSSNIASGTGATHPVYLETVEAYQEYFSHLKGDGVLHINHHFYPRMVTTAARAWRLMGRTDFQSHVIVYERPGGDTIPTMLIKASPWSEEEYADLEAFVRLDDDTPNAVRMVVNPLRPSTSFLSPAFFDGAELKTEFVKGIDYLVRPSTDDWPYFNNIQRGFTPVQPDATRFLDAAMTQAINGRLQWPLGEYAIYAMIGVVGLVLGSVSVLVPLVLSPAGRNPGSTKFVSLAYFGSLGAGFIIIELVLIQIFLKLVGYPLYAFSVVIFTMLAAAGLGSLAAERFGISPARRWRVPFVGIISSGVALLWVYPIAFEPLLALPTLARALACIVLVSPVAFFLGMPLPLGILALEREPAGAVAWAWGTNAIFTVVGGTAAGVLSLFVGFRLTLLMGLSTYMLAFFLFARLRVAHRAADGMRAGCEAEPGSYVPLPVPSEARLG